MGEIVPPACLKDLPQLHGQPSEEQSSFTGQTQYQNHSSVQVLCHQYSLPCFVNTQKVSKKLNTSVQHRHNKSSRIGCDKRACKLNKNCTTRHLLGPSLIRPYVMTSKSV